MPKSEIGLTRKHSDVDCDIMLIVIFISKFGLKQPCVF